MNVSDLYTYLKQFSDDIELVGDGSIPVTGPAKIENARPGEFSFVANEKYRKYIELTEASLLVVGRQLPVEQYSTRMAFLKVRDPYTAFVFLLDRFAAAPKPASPGVAPTAVIGRNARLGKNVSVGEYAIIRDGCDIGDNTVIGPHAVLLEHVRTGSDCLIYPHVVCYHGVRLGNRVTIHSGAVIGADGFGFAPQPDGSYIKIPQAGITEIGDDVEIGAISAVDRATMGSTVVEEGCKIDNLVQIGHNCRIGAHTVIAALAGISGSVDVGRQCMIGGQAGFAGHLSIADRTNIAAKSGITKSLPGPGKAYRGYPAQPMRDQLRQEVLIRNLGAMKQKIEELEAELRHIRGCLG
ncbi:UDP-3-O-(3-hydroxymyristoyl)glucosamine N-acyltransferase [Prosthecochloris sp. HL-130-GSB]|uniref:UDP-3-O-(3-hydroxymyristoyl)glucosamine N-acyltransferase n=1 Tax=Prosthecochloris sp. HL-130-GSB TaxID=1974213 RepID=UPI000A1C032D|nr:UDP-3-O-(3-hydroxymyristoyl)glucosamine N-acyltransferase [Prosthecochloris sp. HL-130-GSB]ARM30680.1 UDP-3-O-(3-hydroxymyristoyl)glucosamine N-acyltransferase [Prosthecochloris sp. HL-130-GSB]